MRLITKNNLFALCLFMLALPARTETLRDPTMPPTQLWQKTDTAIAGYDSPILQSTKLGEQNKAVMINGEIVVLGQQYHGAKLVKVTENTATLRSSDGKQQVLSMDYPVERKWLQSELASPISTSKVSSRKLSNPKLRNQAISEKNDE